MLAKRIIPCLDIRDGRTVKGVNFEGLRDAGDPVELGKEYSRQGADELVFLDITATHEGRKTFAALVKRIAQHISIPFTVGGGINELTDVAALLEAGADKVSVNSAALQNPALIEQIAAHFGNQVVVCAIDAKWEDNKWMCYRSGGRIRTQKPLLDWATEAVERGAGEILFTSMNHDGTRNGFANQALAMLSERLSVPIIASGGAGSMQHFYDAFAIGLADAALAASLFHFKELEIVTLKKFLAEKGIVVRL
ncbi:imidazole glycerol phosphate synthase subunit HisF [Bacteroidia bacterium]|nr:imidazole glycerol phosphate synthase subunit HisF [Bacteroidia bacterium]